MLAPILADATCTSKVQRNSCVVGGSQASFFKNLIVRIADGDSGRVIHRIEHGILHLRFTGSWPELPPLPQPARARARPGATESERMDFPFFLLMGSFTLAGSPGGGKRWGTRTDPLCAATRNAAPRSGSPFAAALQHASRGT